MGPLEGIKVLDFTQFQSGPFATMIMSDLGAEVIKLEDPKQGGDGSRREGADLNGYTIAYTSPNRGKKSMLMDLADQKQRELFYKMAADADVVINNYKPGTMEALGCGYEELKKINPKLVYTSITPYGTTGPMKDCAADDMVIQGESGLMSMVGDMGSRPVKVGIDISDKLAGFYGCIGTLIAVHEAQRTGVGRQVDIAAFDAVIAAMEAPHARYSMAGEVPKTQGNRHPGAVPFGDFSCAEGKKIFISISTDDQFSKMAEALDRKEWLEGPFKLAAGRLEHRKEVDQCVNECFMQYDVNELAAILEENKLPYSILNTVQTIAESEQMEAHNMIVDVVYPDGTAFKCAGTPLKISDMEDAKEFKASPLGYDTMEVAARYMEESEVHELFDNALKEAGR